MSRSIHDDLFPSHVPELQFDNTSSKITSARRQSVSASLNTKEAVEITSSWRMKALVLLCMLSLPGLLQQLFNH